MLRDLRRRRGWVSGLAFPTAVALALRLSVALLAPIGPNWDGAIYARAATQLANGDGYTLGILGLDRTTPTAFYPVGYPAVLAIVRMFGGELTADRVLQSAIGTSVVPLAYLFARRAGGRRAGVLSAWAAALWPGAILLSASWLAEPLFAAAAGLALLPLVYARRRRRARALVIASLLLGCVAYVRASALPIAACVGALHGLLGTRPASRAGRAASALGAAALCLGLACVPLAPWAARNAVLLGAPILVSTNGGFNLLVGARADGDFTPLAHDPCAQGHPHELARDRCYTRQALREITTAPLAWLGRGVLKLSHTFGHESAPAQCFAGALQLPAESKQLLRSWALGLCRLGWLALLVSACAGTLRVARTAPRVMRVVLFAPVLALALLHFVYVGGDRYHAALMPMIAALSGLGFAALGPRARRYGLP